MKNKLLFKTIVSTLVVSFVFSQCVHEDQEIPTPDPPVSSIELISLKTTSPPILDGMIEDSWNDAKTLIISTKVPEAKGSDGTDIFKGYVGNEHAVNLRSMYDDEYIYLLAEWSDNKKDLNRDTWYFDPTDKGWYQESRWPLFNDDDVIIRDAFYEDKFAFLWNVNNTVANWEQSTCYASCHTGLSAADGNARHYTNAPGERIDMWHWKSVRTGLPYDKFDDQYQDESTPNGRHSDPKESGGYTNNTQQLNNGVEDVSVPKYFIPNRKYYYWITQEEIDNATAKLITGVDQNGVLTYDGGTIDPAVDTEFQRDGATSGPKGMPSIYTALLVGNRGDISSSAVHTGSGWILEIKRKLDSGDTDNVDVNFISLDDQPFGIGVFDNAAIAHAITAGLLLKFDK